MPLRSSSKKRDKEKEKEEKEKKKELKKEQKLEREREKKLEKERKKSQEDLKKAQKGSGLASAFSRKSIHKKDHKASTPSSQGGSTVSLPPPSEAFNVRLGAPLVHKPEKSHSSFYRRAKPVQLEKLPSIKSAKAVDKEALVVKKLQQCCVLFDFVDPLSDVKSKEIKRSALQELSDYFGSKGCQMSPAIYTEVCKMFSENCFRTLPPPTVINGVEYDPEEDEPTLEASWPHLQHVYEVFLQFVECRDFKAELAKPHLDQKFALNMLSLFNSEDPRERDLLKTCLHRVYGKILSLRIFIRRAIRDIFLTFIYEPPGTHNGIAELLEILGSIINGFALPLKNEHIKFLLEVLLPLHKPKSLAIFHPQLAYCVIQYIQKDPSLSQQVIKLLLRLWPKMHSPKECMFLSEVEEILELISLEDFDTFKIGLFKQLARCIGSYHFQVAERSLNFWHNPRIIDLLHGSSQDLLPIIFPNLFKASKGHWNRNIHGLVMGTMQVFMDLDADTFRKCHDDFTEKQSQVKQKVEARVEKWRKLEELASKNPKANKVVLRHKSLPRLPSLATINPDSDILTELKDFSGPETIPDAGMRRRSLLPMDENVQKALQQFQQHQLTGDMDSSRPNTAESESRSDDE